MPVLVGVVAGAAVTLLVQWLVVRPPVPQQFAPSDPSLDPQVSSVIAKLDEVITLQRELGKVATAEGGADRKPVDEAQETQGPSNSSELGRLRDSIEALRTSLEGMQTPSQLASAPLRGKKWLDRTALPLPNDGSGYLKATEQLTSEHKLWSVHQVIESYGAPDEIRDGGTGGLVLVYICSDQNRRCEFHSTAGFVTKVTCGE